MLKFEEITKLYQKDNQDIYALDDFSLSINKGDFIAIQGPSGCGKTTLLLTAGGLLKPDKGEVFINGESIYNLSTEKRASFRAQNIGFVFQQYHLIPYLNVIENIRVPALAMNTKADENKITELIEMLGLGKRINHTPAELSAGEKQRTALARALLFNPALLLADEITGNLDEVNVEIVMNCLSEYKNQGGTILLVTHDKDLGIKADKVLNIKNGKRVFN
jgi:putative ABC transport system ATP-binding protein